MRTEYFDVLDCRGEKNGEVIARDEAHRTGTWHGAFHCLIIREHEGRGYTLLQMRSATKKIAPGKLDVSVGGHYTSGEDARIAGPREIKEELGLVVPYVDLIPIGRRVFVYCFTPGIKECEFQDVFLLSRTFDVHDLVLQAEELDGIIEVDVEQGISLLSGRTAEIDVMMLTPDGSSERIGVTAQDFVPCVDNYYLRFFLIAQRYTKGEREYLMI